MGKTETKSDQRPNNGAASVSGNLPAETKKSIRLSQFRDYAEARVTRCNLASARIFVRSLHVDRDAALQKEARILKCTQQSLWNASSWQPDGFA